MKRCELGSHDVEKLWRAKGKTQLSGCKDCVGKEKSKQPPSYVSNSTEKKPVKVYSTSTATPKRPTVSHKTLNSLEERSIPELIKLAVIVFNKWIRKRDSDGDYFKCISCEEVKHISAMQCGHFMPSTYTSLKLDEYNCNGECEQCNCHDPNHLKGYRKNLILKVGYDKVLELEQTPLAKYYKYEREELYEIINKYK